MPLARLLLEVDGVEHNVRAASRRLADLERVALDVNAFAKLEAIAIDLGFKIVNAQPQHHRATNLVGWRLTLEKPPTHAWVSAKLSRRLE